MKEAEAEQIFKQKTNDIKKLMKNLTNMDEPYSNKRDCLNFSFPSGPY